MVITQGIHFHHFWYGLVLTGVAGWLGIVYNDDRYTRIYAVVFGVGLGFIGDEVGLLLTFGNYYSELTLDFFVAAVAFVIIVVLLLRYGKQIERDVLGLSARERLTFFGIFLAGFSAIFFAFGAFEFAVPLLVGGLGLFAWAFERRRAEALNPPA